MQTVKRIIESHGYESAQVMDVGERIEVTNEGFMPLIIEKNGENHLTVAHYFEQGGDRMRDPEICFHIGGEEWTPIEFWQDPAFHRHDKHGLDIGEFLDMWNGNLRKQGFLDVATQEDK